ncbi:putative polyol transporter 1 [Triticum dicoccoides]|uniref:Major facilitator superfamily (MFS) profile domain-containing protein n=1 Tax=Triticum turgidum subsp. durum TaxID=4567 RepID=A0A9R0R772_TRITD|nr:putative polyol transporter 1 [Triticum dicoccoides]VAH23567.1 unnamed protein product [Triticum turgidum subsp. durum]
MASAALPEAAVAAAVQPKKKGNFKYACTCALSASMATVVLGYDVGVMSGASLYIKEDLRLTDVQVEIMMGILSVYALLGSFAGARTSDWIGRRYTVIIAAAIFFVGSLLMGFAVDYLMFMLGRFVCGMGVGFAIMVAPVYTAEVAPASTRGLLTSFTEVFINVGILLGYVSNYAFARLPHHINWRIMLGVGAVPSALLALMVLGMPESPRWLVMKGRLADARVVLEKTSDTPEEAVERLDQIKAAAGIPHDLDGDVVAVPKRKGGNEKQVWKELIFSPTPVMRRILLAALGVHFFQQATGSDSVVLYSPRVFKSAGITGDNHLLGVTCAMGVTKTLFILLATFQIDRVGRRPLLLTSTAGMLVCLIGLGTGLTVVGQHPDEKITWAIGLCIASTLAYVSFFSMGLGPITSVYVSEVFPLRVRALGFALGVACNRVTSAAISMTFLSLSKAITIGGSFFLYAGLAALGWLFFYAFVPETRGQPLEDIGKLFGMKDAAVEDDDHHHTAATKDKQVKAAAVEMN